MERIAGLKEYVAWKQYRSALGLPDQVTEEYHMLAQGEYNRNYLFTHPVTGRKLVLRGKLRQPDAFGTSDTVRI